MKLPNFKIVFFLLFAITSGFAQVGIGTTNPDASSILDVKSTGNNQGILIPTLSKSQINGITLPANGLTVYNSDDNTFSVNIGTTTAPVWKNLLTTDMSNNKPVASAVTLTGTFSPSGVITGGYTYTDTENDTQYNSIGKFYIADDALGTNATVVSTTYSNPRTYTLLIGQLNKYVAFGITPVAAAGNSPGAEVMTSYTKVVGRQAFAYTGAIQNFTVPAGITSLTVKIWGAGGGGSDGSGGSGAYVKGTLAVTPGQVLAIVVGKGGSNSSAAGYGGGGSSTVNGGSGGGYSGIFNTTLTFANSLAIAGGGGGGGYFGDVTYGGGGGNTSGTNGGNTGFAGYTSGSGGTTAGGGAGGLFNNATGRSSNGTALTGGNGLTTSPNTGGGGGGGYYGGGSGYCANNASGYYSSAGGGGASYIGTLTTVTNSVGTTSAAGLATQAPGSADTDYVTGIGNGGDGEYLSTITTVGGNGLVIITY